MYESCTKCMSHVTCEWVISHTNESLWGFRPTESTQMYESCHVGMRHITYEWVMWRVNGSYNIWMRHDTCKSSHITNEWVVWRVNESYHIWMSHATCKWVTSHMNESCNMWISQFTRGFRMVPSLYEDSDLTDAHIRICICTWTGYASILSWKRALFVQGLLCKKDQQTYWLIFWQQAYYSLSSQGLLCDRDSLNG